ncbi:hypothetical protein [Pontitalea aquivivens]|uniref:hypothetical protein n=1 Tax=Pontitalea aquivivens TaxID=3388663 RepID=UPI003970661D
MSATKGFRARLTALMIAASVVLGAVPAAAQQVYPGNDTRSILPAIAGVVALGLIVDGIDKKKEREREQERQAQEQRHYGDYRDRDRWAEQGDRRQDRNQWQRRDQRLIPAHCVTDIRVDRKKRDVVAERCLRREGLDRRMPQACAFDIRTERGRGTVYGLNCLRERGFRVARR